MANLNFGTTVGGVPVLTTSDTQTITNKTYVSPYVTGYMGIGVSTPLINLHVSDGGFDGGFLNGGAGIIISQNAYISGSWKFINTGYAYLSGIQESTGDYYIYHSSASGASAGAAITWVNPVRVLATSTADTLVVDVDGINTTKQFISTLATGTKPIDVTSTTVCTNLNADLLDGYHASSAASNSTIVLRESAGYINCNYINTTANVTATSPSHIAVQTGSDSYIRWQTLAQFISNVGLGTSGWSGYSGKSGYSGTNGSTGATGTSGWSGYSGKSGYSGTSGWSGYSGKSGYSGTSGWSGYSGKSGYSGISGFSGISDSLTILTTPAATNTASGVKLTLTATAAMAFGDVGYINSSGNVSIGNAGTISTASCSVMCVSASIAAGGSGTFMMTGIARRDTWTWTIGGIIYLSTTGTTGNTLTQSLPSSSGNTVQVLGIALSATKIMFMPQLSQVELS